MLTCTSPKMTRQDPQSRRISINLSAVIHHHYEEGCQKVYSNGMKQTWARISLKNGRYMLFDIATRHRKKNFTCMEAMWLESSMLKVEATLQLMRTKVMAIMKHISAITVELMNPKNLAQIRCLKSKNRKIWLKRVVHLSNGRRRETQANRQSLLGFDTSILAVYFRSISLNKEDGWFKCWN